MLKPTMGANPSHSIGTTNPSLKGGFFDNIPLIPPAILMAFAFEAVFGTAK